MSSNSNIRLDDNFAGRAVESIVQAKCQDNDEAAAADANPIEVADKMQQLGMHIGKVAHELRNPLGTINTSAYLIERHSQSDNPKLVEAIDRMKGAIGRCDRLIAELLDFAKANQLAKDRIPLDLWLTRILGEQAQNLPRELELEFNLGVGEAMVTIDAHKMQAAIANLINNATEALMGKNENSADYYRQDPKIRISSRLTQRGVEISVYNNGPKIDEQDLEKILTPLYTTKSFGTGLGLSVVQDTLRQHDGGLEIENGSDTGVTFTAWVSSGLSNSAHDCDERTGSIMCGLN
jgi:signal transduction histidine kinase